MDKSNLDERTLTNDPERAHSFSSMILCWVVANRASHWERIKNGNGWGVGILTLNTLQVSEQGCCRPSKHQATRGARFGGARWVGVGRCHTNSTTTRKSNTSGALVRLWVLGNQRSKGQTCNKQTRDGRLVQWRVCQENNCPTSWSCLLASCLFGSCVCVIMMMRMAKERRRRGARAVEGRSGFTLRTAEVRNRREMGNWHRPSLRASPPRSCDVVPNGKSALIDRMVPRSFSD